MYKLAIYIYLYISLHLTTLHPIYTGTIPSVWSHVMTTISKIVLNVVLIFTFALGLVKLEYVCHYPTGSSPFICMHIYPIVCLIYRGGLSPNFCGIPLTNKYENSQVYMKKSFPCQTICYRVHHLFTPTTM